MVSGHKIKLPKGYRLDKSGKVEAKPVYRNVIHRLQAASRVKIKRGRR